MLTINQEVPIYKSDRFVFQGRHYVIYKNVYCDQWTVQSDKRSVQKVGKIYFGRKGTRKTETNVPKYIEHLPISWLINFLTRHRYYILISYTILYCLTILMILIFTKMLCYSLYNYY